MYINVLYKNIWRIYVKGPETDQKLKGEKVQKLQHLNVLKQEQKYHTSVLSAGFHWCSFFYQRAVNCWGVEATEQQLRQSQFYDVDGGLAGSFSSVKKRSSDLMNNTFLVCMEIFRSETRASSSYNSTEFQCSVKRIRAPECKQKSVKSDYIFTGCISDIY